LRPYKTINCKKQINFLEKLEEENSKEMFTKFTRKAFSTLVIADHADGKLSKSLYKVLTAAKKLNKEVNHSRQ